MSALRSVPREYIPKANQYVMEKCIKSKRLTEKSVHNMAFYLYAESENEPALISYLEGEEAKKENNQPIFFEVDYALNLCKQKEDRLSKELETASVANKKSITAKLNYMKQAQIILYGILSLYNKAVKLALSCKKNFELAYRYANKPEDAKTKKKLWLRIAKVLFDNCITSTRQHAKEIINHGRL